MQVRLNQIEKRASGTLLAYGSNQLLTPLLPSTYTYGTLVYKEGQPQWDDVGLDDILKVDGGSHGNHAEISLSDIYPSPTKSSFLGYEEFNITDYTNDNITYIDSERIRLQHPINNDDAEDRTELFPGIIWLDDLTQPLSIAHMHPNYATFNQQVSNNVVAEALIGQGKISLSVYNTNTQVSSALFQINGLATDPDMVLMSDNIRDDFFKDLRNYPLTSSISGSII